MNVDEQLVKEVAELAKLEVADEELARYIGDMNQILQLVEEMQAVNTNGIEPLANPLDATQRLRPDEVTETDQHERYQAVAPETEDGLYLVPRVVE